MSASIEFFAKTVVAQTSDEDECYLVGLADDGKKPKQHVLLQRAFSFDDFDEENGMDGHWFEYQDYSDYKACQKVQLYPDRIEIQVAPHAKKVTKHASQIVVRFAATPELLGELSKTLRQIFQDVPSVFSAHV